jgi:hypothetical protein
MDHRELLMNNSEQCNSIDSLFCFGGVLFANSQHLPNHRTTKPPNSFRDQISMHFLNFSIILLSTNPSSSINQSSIVTRVRWEASLEGDMGGFG